jgi:hypothetical protein
MAPEQKTESLLVRMGESELRMLRELADHTGLSMADVIRQLVRREHSAVKPSKAVVGKAELVERNPVVPRSDLQPRSTPNARNVTFPRANTVPRAPVKKKK